MFVYKKNRNITNAIRIIKVLSSERGEIMWALALFKIIVQIDWCGGKFEEIRATSFQIEMFIAKIISILFVGCVNGIKCCVMEIRR